MPATDDDDQAAKYELADDLLRCGGIRVVRSVELGAVHPMLVSRHNLAYWKGYDWWGFGPGAHSHVGGVRWWNVRHPRAYAERHGRRGRARRRHARCSTPRRASSNAFCSR